MLKSTKYIYTVVDSYGKTIANTLHSRESARRTKRCVEESLVYNVVFKAPFKIVRYSNPEVVR